MSEYVGAWQKVGMKQWRRQVKQDHFFKKFQGFGISKPIIVELIKHYAGETDQELHFIYCGVNKVTHYKCNLQLFIDSKKEFDNFGDVQRIVSTKDMIVVE